MFYCVVFLGVLFHFVLSRCVNSVVLYCSAVCFVDLCCVVLCCVALCCVALFCFVL